MLRYPLYKSDKYHKIMSGNPRKYKRFFNSKAWKHTNEVMKESLEKRMKEQDYFEYSNEDFQIKIDSESVKVKWADLREIYSLQSGPVNS